MLYLTRFGRAVYSMVFLYLHLSFLNQSCRCFWLNSWCNFKCQLLATHQQKIIIMERYRHQPLETPHHQPLFHTLMMMLMIIFGNLFCDTRCLFGKFIEFMRGARIMFIAQRLNFYSIDCSLYNRLNSRCEHLKTFFNFLLFIERRK